MKEFLYKFLLLSCFLFITTVKAFPQEASAVNSGHFGGSITATSNGISFIPYISLGKPAVIFDMFIGKKKLSFEPQFRFASDGKPWAFVFWWRYKLLNTGKFQVNIAGHPSVVFKTIPVPDNNGYLNINAAHQYLAGEISPNYYIFKNVSVGVYYFYSRGLDRQITRNTNMFAFRTAFSNIRLSEEYYLRFNPQVYYLSLDDRNGFYFSESVSLLKKNFPLSLSSLINTSIRTDIPAKKYFLWNISLIYSFNQEYVRK
jgi:hypothetical protein